MTNIIGIHNTGIQSSLFSLSNKKFFGIPEERLTRIKYDKYFPTQNLNIFLKNHKISRSNKIKFIIAWNPILNINEKYRPSISEWPRHPAERLYSNINHIIPNLNLDLDEASKIVFDKSQFIKPFILYPMGEKRDSSTFKNRERGWKLLIPRYRKLSLDLR